MTAPLREVLMRVPDDAFGRAFDDSTHGFRHPVDLAEAKRQHETLRGLLGDLGVSVRLAIATLDRIAALGTIEGGDTFWLRPDLLCIGRSLRTNRAGAGQLAALVGGRVEIFDLPYWRGPAEVLHLLSVISPVADDLAVVFAPLLPAGLHELLAELGIRMLAVDEAEFETLGCNVLAVRPGVVILAEGNRRIAAALARAGCEVHTFAASEIGLNGSGGPTCLTRPIWRET
jgi:dimethylargininase